MNNQENNYTNQDINAVETVENHSGIRGELTYEDKVIQKIVGIALEDIPGLLGVSGGFFSNVAGKLVNTDDKTSGVGVEVGKEQVAVDLDIVAEYGENVATIYDKIKEVVSAEINKMTDLEVVEVNVNVVDVKTHQQYEAEQVTVQDRLSNAAESTSNFMSEQSDKAERYYNKQEAKYKANNQPRVK